jgi:hypothetical protein
MIFFSIKMNKTKCLARSFSFSDNLLTEKGSREKEEEEDAQRNTVEYYRQKS